MQPAANTALSRLSRPVLNLASLVFKGISFLNIELRALAQKEFPHLFIISVDNLSFGGTGKTPLVLAIGRALEKQGARFAVISRGYRSAYEKKGTLVQAAHACREVGDEPLLLKASFPDQDVFVGRDRVRSLAAAAAAGRRIVILDDGFQSSHIKKDFSVLLLNPGHPYFYLRNFKFMRRRADRVLTFRPAGRGAKPAPAATYDFVPGEFMNARGLAVAVGDAPIVAFSALGDNERFAGDMRQHGLLAFRGYSDHKAFGPADLRDLDEWRKASGGERAGLHGKGFLQNKKFPARRNPFIICTK